MPIEHDIQEEAARLNAIRGQIEKALRSILQKGSVRIGARSTSSHMQDAKGGGLRRPEDEGPLRMVTGRLSRAVVGTRGRLENSGGSSERTTNLTVDGAKATYEIKIKVPYAAAHEYGTRGVVYVRPHHRTITEAFGKKLDEPMRVQVQGHAYRRTVKARPYIGPAVEDERAKITEIAEETFRDFLRAQA